MKTNSKWCSTDKNNKNGITLDNITSVSGYNQIINTPTHFTRDSSTCCDSTFSLSKSYFNTVIEQSIYNKCHHSHARNSVLI